MVHPKRRGKILNIRRVNAAVPKSWVRRHAKIVAANVLRGNARLKWIKSKLETGKMHINFGCVNAETLIVQKRESEIRVQE